MKIASEDDILAVVERFFPVNHPALMLGRGDDCAVLRRSGPMAVTTDIFAEDAHFRRRYFTPFDIGFKALAVNISDVGASGAVPSGLSIGLTLTGREDEEWLSGFCEGMKTLCDEFSLALSGGDLARSSLLNVCITAWGDLPEQLPQGLRRGVAEEGDILFLVGETGLARLGLTLLEECADEKTCEQVKNAWPEACAKHLRPMPLAREGVAIATFALKHGLQDRLGLMDISDGLARDLPRLLASRRSGLGADISLSPDDLPRELLQYAGEHNIAAADFAFEGGEDYALAGTCPADFWPELARILSTFPVPALVLGTVRPGPVTLNGEIPASAGFDHFSR